MSFNHIYEVLEYQVQNRSSHPFLLFKDETYSYSEFKQHVDRTAYYFYTKGIKKDVHVALIMKNSPAYIMNWFALAKLGAVMIPVNYHLKKDSLSFIIRHSDATHLIYDSIFYDSLEDAGVLDDEVNCYSTEQISNEQKKVTENLDVKITIERQDLMSIIYTSGTTGLPKGVMLPHASYIYTGLNYKDYIVQLTKEDVAYTCLPLFHCNAQQSSVMGVLLTGATLALSERFSVRNFWNEIREFKATTFNYIGSMLSILFKQDESKKDQQHQVTRIFGGAAAKEIWKAFEKRFDLTVIEGFGLTEVATVAFINPLYRIKVGSIGKPLQNFLAEIVDESGEQVMPNVAGEIVIKSEKPYAMFTGYYKMPDKAEESVRNGWFYTGDRGYMDEDGYFYFMDRIKDCIRYRGENISSYEIEQVVMKYPNVLEAAAYGVPSDYTEEDVKVAIVLKDKSILFDYEKFIRFCEREMAFYMIPRYVEIKDMLPKTPTERVQKFLLKEEGNEQAWDRVKERIDIKK